MADRSIAELEAEAERLFPYPVRACVWVRMKIDWKRKEWVKGQEKANP